MTEVFICDYIRTPVGRYGGSLSSVRADDLGAIPLKALVQRNSAVDWEAVDDVVFGCANQAGEDNRNVARMSLLLAGLPVSISGTTINRLCGSGMDAVITAARAIKSGEAELMIAGGVERALLQTLMRLPTLGLVLVRSVVMDDFKGRHFTGEVILWAVRWYCRYGISYRDLEEMLAERGIDVDHTTIYRWVQRYAPEMEKRLRWFWRRGFDPSWRLDETYVKVRGKWTYLYRAVDKRGDTIDFYLSPTRGAKAAKRFLGKTLRGLKDWEKPTKLNTDKAPSYGAAIAELKREGKLAPETEHRQVKYLNNVLEADHGKLKMLIKPVRGFKSMPTAYATIKGFEVMRALRKGQARAWCLQPGIRGEVRLIERSFGIGPSAMTEAMAMLNQHFNKAA